MLLLSVVLLVTTPMPAQKAKPPTKAEVEAAKKAEEEAAAKAAEAEAARKAAEELAAKEAAAKAADDAAKQAALDQKKAEEAALSARGLDARLRALSDLVALPLKRLPGDHRDQRFAVVPFEAVGAEAQDKQLGLVVSDVVVTNLARDHRLPLVERAALAKILDEQALGQTGALADGQAAAVGKVAGARALIVGQVADAGAGFRVSVRAIDIETGGIVDGTAREATIPKEEMIAFSANAVVLRSKSGAMFRSVVLPGWGQVYNDEPVKAGVVGATTGTLAAATITTAAIGGYMRFVLYDQIGFRDEDKDLSPEAKGAAAAQTRVVGEGNLVAAGILGGLTAAAWGFGILDAYLSGTDVESLDAALARN
jgi:TolB-like protein